MLYSLRAICVSLGGLIAIAHAQGIETYRGMCDASAAEAIGRQHFVVANDEDNLLRVYERGKPDSVSALDIGAFLEVDSESDLEGAATIGSRIYWISSHGNNRTGKQRPDRHRFFATEFDISRTPPVLVPVGEPYRGLRQALLDADSLKSFNLNVAIDKGPENGGLNIEGLAVGQDGKSLLIGFRSPLVRGKALVVELENPGEIVAGSEPRLGQAVLLDLGGRGIRSIERVGSSYMVVAGPVDDTGTFAIYRWGGPASTAPPLQTATDLKALSAEAMFVVPNTRTVQLLSDDGGVEVNGVECKRSPIGTRSFRSVVIPQ